MEIVRNNLIPKCQACEGIVENSAHVVSEIPTCSFSGEPADYYIGLSGQGYHDEIRVIGAICSKFVETAILNILGQGVDEVKWPVILDLKKEIYYHSYPAHLNGLSPIIGWKSFITLQHEKL
ncbi:MAG: hypothetical protein HUJ11_05605 [Arenibacter algicola]|nr:hypothetical protein [Arenibacter algicola]